MTLHIPNTDDYIDYETNMMYVHLHPYENITICDSDWCHFLYVYDGNQRYEVDFEALHDPAYVRKQMCFDETKQRNVERWEIPLKSKGI